MPPCELLCQYLEEDKRREFVDGMAEVRVKCEEVIIRQNDKGNNFFIIKEGTCDVWVADAEGERKNTRTLSAGSWCGELSLLTGNAVGEHHGDEPRGDPSCTIGASSRSCSAMQMAASAP